MNGNEIGERIHNIIDDQRITQTKLAEDIGIKLPRLNNYMTGQAKFPSEIIKKIAEVLNTSTD